MCPKPASLTKQPNFKFHVLFYSIFDFKKAFNAGDVNQTFCALINDTFVHLKIKPKIALEDLEEVDLEYEIDEVVETFELIGSG